MMVKDSAASCALSAADRFSRIARRFSDKSQRLVQLLESEHPVDGYR